MGVNFSAGPWSPRLHAFFAELSLLKLRGFYLKFEKLRKKQDSIVKRDELFISREEARFVFQFSSMQTYELFKCLDHEHKGRIGALDFWGSLALATTDNPDEKIEYCFFLLDYTKQGYLSKHNLQTLFFCVTRGIARLKNISAPPVKVLNKLIVAVKGLARTNEKGEVPLRDLRSYLASDENVRSYFSGLGSAVEAVDTGKLVSQRSDCLKEIAETEQAIREELLTSAYTQADLDAYQKERGGDISALLMTNELKSLGSKVEAAIYDEGDKKAKEEDDADGMPTEAQRMRRLARARAAAGEDGKKQLIKDAMIFADTKARNAKGGAEARGGGGVGSLNEDSFMRKWLSLPQLDDHLCHLDMDLIEDLFEAAGIILTDDEANDCLFSCKENQLGKRSAEMVMAWYRRKQSIKIPIRKPPLYRLVANDLVDFVKETQDALFSLIEALDAQKKIVDALKEKQEVVLQRSYTEEEASAAEKKSKGSAYNVLGELKGSVRFAAWQRQSLLSSPTELSWKALFGHPNDVEDEVEEKENAEEGNEAPASFMDKLKAGAKQAQEQRNAPANEEDRWKTRIRIEAFINPPPQGSDRAPFYDSKTGLTMKELVDISALDLLDVFKKKQSSSAAGSNMGPSETPFGTVGWLFIDVHPSATEHEAFILEQTTKNFFESIPSDYRANLYTHVVTKLVYVPTAGQDGDSGGGNDNIGSVRAIVLALLHEEDFYRQMEEQLPAGVLISRGFRNITFAVGVLSSLSSMYDTSLSFEGFEDRLFGPQEDELGEEGMNPIRFAKLQRQRQNAARESIDRAMNMRSEELQKHLKERGLSTKGTHDELAKRAKAAFKRQAEISGFGELSAYGADMSEKIFKLVKKHSETLASSRPSTSQKPVSKGGRDKTKGEPEPVSSADSKLGGMTLWEMNELLAATGSETIYDNKEYKAIMSEQQLLVDKNDLLLLGGLGAYYEQYGRLGTDVFKLGIGSLNDTLKGEMEAFASYDVEAITSLLVLLEKHSVLQKPLKTLLGILASTSNVSIEGEFDCISDLLNVGETEWGKQLQDIFKTPGWLSATIHKMSEWLADEESGVLRSLRNTIRAVFGKYDQWHEVFSEIIAALPPSSSHDQVDESLTTQQQTQLEAERKAQIEEVLLQKLMEASPPLAPDVSIKKVIALNHRSEEIAKLIASTDEHLVLTREQREELMNLRDVCIKQAASSSLKVEDNKNICGAYACAAYDALRLFGRGILCAGWGTKEFNFRVTLKGLDWVQYLPKGLGEASIPRQLKEDKMHRAAQRKSAALAAMERERMRRDPNGEEREVKRKEKAAKVQKKRDDEEAQLFSNAFEALSFAREERKSTAEIAAMTRQWEKLAQIKTSRYPDTLRAAACLNNLACVLNEFYGPSHFKGKEAVTKQEIAVGIVMVVLKSYKTASGASKARDGVVGDEEEDIEGEAHRALPVFVQRESEKPPDPGEELDVLLERDSLGLGSTTDTRVAAAVAAEAAAIDAGRDIVTLPDDVLVPMVVILQNFISLIRDAANNFLLKSSVSVTDTICALYDTLNNDERARLQKGLSRNVENMSVFAYGDLGMQLAMTVGEHNAAEHDMEEKRRLKQLADEEALKRTMEEDAEKLSVQLGGGESGSPKFKRRNAAALVGIGGVDQKAVLDADIEAAIRARDEKKEKSEMRRKAAGQKRMQVIRQRNKLYHLIKSDEISAIFARKAGHVLSDSATIQWGDAPPVADMFDLSSEETSTLMSKDDDGENSINTKDSHVAGAQDGGIARKPKKKYLALDGGVSIGEGSLNDSVSLDDTMDNLSLHSMANSVETLQDQLSCAIDGPPPSLLVEEEQPKKVAAPKGRAGLLSWLFRNRQQQSSDV